MVLHGQERTMAADDPCRSTAQVSLRLPVELLQRADRLAAPIAQEVTAFRVTRAALLRLALERGLAQLEVETQAGEAEAVGACLSRRHPRRRGPPFQLAECRRWERCRGRGRSLAPSAEHGHRPRSSARQRCCAAKKDRRPWGAGYGGLGVPELSFRPPRADAVPNGSFEGP